MGLPAAPLLLLLLLLLLCPVTPVSSCLAVPPGASEDLNLTGTIPECAELDWSQFHGQRRLLLRHNGIEALSPSSRLGPEVEQLDLAENRLRELPRGFFSNATALRSLHLEGNPLPAVPPDAFQPTLRSLSVSCRCDVVGTVLAPCSRAGMRCRCLTSRRDSFNLTEFQSRECGLGAGLPGGLAGAAAGVAALGALGAAGLWYRRRRAAAAVAGTGCGKADPAGGLRQPRYISRDAGLGTAGVSDAADAPDYENVFVSPGSGPGAARGWAPGWQEQSYSPQVPEDEDYYLGSDADCLDQPIYANTLCPTEDVYIVPDQ